MKSSSVTILHDTQEWTTRFENLRDVEIDGQKIMQIHDLAKNVNKQNKQIRTLAITVTCMALAVLTIISAIGWWLLSHESAIERVLLTGNRDFDVMQYQAREWRSHKRQRAWVHLEHHQGLYWDEGMQDWVLPASFTPVMP